MSKIIPETKEQSEKRMKRLMLWLALGFVPSSKLRFASVTLYSGGGK